MTKRRTAAGLAILAVLATAASALAQQQNTYTVTASVSPKGKGSSSKPVPVAVKFGYHIGEATGLKPAAVSRYTIGFGGLRTNGRSFATCAASKMQGSDADCNRKALVGSGTLQAFVYNDADPSGGSGGFPCAKTLHIWNAGANKAVLFIGGDPSRCGGVGNLAPIPAKYVKFRNGQALRFDVPQTVRHPVAGLTVAVTDVAASLPRRTATVKRRKVGYFESIAKSHPVEVTFLTEKGQTAKASTKA